eukprot:gene18485-24982_t
MKVVSPDLRLVMVDVGAGIASGYTTPGQYIQVKVAEADKAAFFAIASAPAECKEGVLELLIKIQPGSAAEAVTQQSEGAELLVGPVEGKGFKVETIADATTVLLMLLKIQPGSAAEAVTQQSEGAELLVGPVEGKGFKVETIADATTVLLVATGSGISPIKAVIDSGILGKAKLHLFYGTKAKELSAYQELIPKWEAGGMKVTQVDAGLISDPKSVAVLMCGHKDMCNEVKETLTAAGVNPDAILLNF